MHPGIELDHFSDPSAEDIWTQLERGEYTREEVWTAYRANLKYILDKLELLLDNINYDSVIITSDHGNAFGEYGFYGHPEGIPLDCLRKVPWALVSSQDKGNYEAKMTRENTSKEVATKLEDLGYK
jgi:hypothetical protein